VRYVPLIWSAFFRRPAQTWLVLMAVTSGFGLFSFMLGLNSTANQVIDAARDDRLYVNSGYDSPTGLPIAMEEQLKTIDGVTGVGAFRWVYGYHQIPRNSTGVFTIDDGMRVAMAEYPISASQWDELFSSGTGMLVTQKAADRWGLHKGDVFPISVKPGTRQDGAPSWTFEVLEIIPDVPQWTGGVMIGNYRYAENARPLESRGQVVGFTVAVSDPRRTPSIASQIDHRFANSGTPTLSVSSKANAEAQVRSGVAIASLTWGVGTAGLFMILFLTGNSISQSVRRRIPEFATLKAMGYTDWVVTKLVLAEAAILCCLGAALGTVLAGLLASVPRRHIPGSLLSVPHATVSLGTFGWALGLAVLIAVIGSVLPIFSLMRLQVSAAIGGRAR
jgi:putative ABC transport system permease protein